MLLERVVYKSEANWVEIIPFCSLYLLYQFNRKSWALFELLTFIQFLVGSKPSLPCPVQNDKCARNAGKT
jgi:hypothetical protein